MTKANVTYSNDKTLTTYYVGNDTTNQEITDLYQIGRMFVVNIDNEVSICTVKKVDIVR
jgi:hypothetical protein